MMGALATWAVAAESFRLLRRDRIFVPAAICGTAVAILANVMSNWSIEDFGKILVDVGGFGFTLTGTAVAIFWGVKIVRDAREGGALEVQLAAPISRTQWLLGKFLGLVACLGMLAVLLLVIWQLLMFANDFGWVNASQLAMFATMLAGWVVTAALAMLLASLASMGVAIFATMALWLAGQSSALILATIPPTADASTRAIVAAVARYWDFQQFNLIAPAASEQAVAMSDLLMRSSYAGLLVLLLLSLAMLGFSRRDLV